MSDYQQTEFLEHLSKLSTGERARLKRCAGQSLNEAREKGLFYRVLPKGIPEIKEPMYFLVATLYPMAENSDEGDFGMNIRKARDEKNYKGLDKRVQVLLDSDEAQLPYRLRQSIHFLASRRIKVNWQKLLADLLEWEDQGRHVQRRWARNYFIE